MHRLLESHELGKGYFIPKDKESALATLAFYLEGKPDEPGWRKCFLNTNQTIPIPIMAK